MSLKNYTLDDDYVLHSTGTILWRINVQTSIGWVTRAYLVATTMKDLTVALFQNANIFMSNRI